jgi:hypothetical protein
MNARDIFGQWIDEKGKTFTIRAAGIEFYEVITEGERSGHAYTKDQVIALITRNGWVKKG